MRLLGRRLPGCGRGVAAARAVMKKLPSRRQFLRSGAGITAFLLVLSAPSLVYNIYVQTIEMNFFQLQMERFRAYPSPPPSNGCSIPHYDPFDDGIRKFIYPYAPVDCGWHQPYLTYVDADGYIHINESSALEAGLRKKDIECTYEVIRRSEFNVNEIDNKVEFRPERVFRDGEKLPEPFVKVKCLNLFNGRLVYETVHTFLEPLSREQSERVKPASALQPSVLIIGIDSMSRLNFIRQLPRIHALITETFGAAVFRGLVKVGDNTYPNMLTMLTGMAARPHPDIHVASWGKDKADGFFDDLPTAWKNFSENGYLTMYAEDEPILSIFNYLAKGFVKQPTDYYMRPFWLGMDTIRNFRSRDSRCFGNIPTHEYLFNYTRDFVTKMRDKRYFAFTFMTGYSHSCINEVQALETPLYEFLAELHRSGALNNTVLVVMGDHGNRFDAIRATVMGRVEERMPYFAVALPPDLRAARPYLEEGLRGNRDIMITWFDVYEMLMDIALDNLQPASRVTRWAGLGYSLFRPVPQRKCIDAGVMWEYCVCIREHMQSTREPDVWAAAHTLVAHVNALLEGAQPAGACAPLALADVVSAQILVPPMQVASPQGFSVDLRIVVRVTPSQALLEGQVCHDAWIPEGHVKGEVARINKYGNQSHCIRDKILRLYCYCTDLLPHTSTPAPSA